MTCPRASCSNLTGTPSVLVISEKLGRNSESRTKTTRIILLLRSIFWFHDQDTSTQVMRYLELVCENRIDVFWQSRDHGRLHGLPSKGETTIGSGLGVGPSGTIYSILVKMPLSAGMATDERAPPRLGRLTGSAVSTLFCAYNTLPISRTTSLQTWICSLEPQ